MKHGHAPRGSGNQSNIYRRWQHMIQRCYNPQDRDYPRYGGRGVTVCLTWRAFPTFISDMGMPPSKAHTLDRIDNNGPYSKANCRWASPTEQANNRRTTRYLTVDGETKPLSVWCAALGIGSKTVLYRLKQGLSDRDALYTPAHRGNKLRGN